MAHVTLSIPDKVYGEMKSHPEIKWSEIVRQAIIEKAISLKKTMPSAEFWNLLPAETRKNIAQVSEKEWKAFTQKMKEKEWKRTQLLTRA